MTLSEFLMEWRLVVKKINPGRKDEPIIECEPKELMCSLCRRVLPVNEFRFATPTRRATRCKKCEHLTYSDWKRQEKENG